MVRYITHLERSAADHFSRRVVERGERVDIISVPAAVFLPALKAHTVGRSVEDLSGVRIVILLVNIAPDYLVKAAIGIAQAHDPACNVSPQPGFSAAANNRLHH